jgi:hypothetical protein
MDFMNLNQAAHGDREHGFIWSRMRLNRKVVVGHWQDATYRKNSARGRVPRGVARLAGARSSPLRRQHARSGGHRRRQGFRADANSALPSTATASAIS